MANKMNKLIKNILLGTFFLYSLSLSAKNVNVAELDIGGIKLGMNPDQVIEKIVDTYQIEKQKLSIGDRRSEGVEYVSEISYNSKKMNIRVKFCCTREGKDNTPLVVVEYISYGIPFTVENKKSMRDMALSKYGEPSKKTKNDIYWCDHLGKSPFTCATYEPKLHLTNTNIYLKDEGYSKRLKEFLRKKKIVKPKF